MDWSDVGAIAAKAAPMIGGLFGPAGAAVGGIVASAFGCANTPDAVASALQADPAAAVKLKQIEADHEVELRQLTLAAESRRMAEATTRLTQINQTMRAELTSDSTFKAGWRPALGWEFAIALGFLAVVLGVTMLRDPTVLAKPEFNATLVWLFVTMGSALGINVHKRSQDKQTRSGVVQPGILQAIAQRLQGSGSSRG